MVIVIGKWQALLTKMRQPLHELDVLSDTGFCMNWMYCADKVFGLGTLTSELYETPTKDIIASAVGVFNGSFSFVSISCAPLLPF